MTTTSGTHSRKNTHMREHPKHDKIHEALQLLNEVAIEKKEELWETITDKYTSVKDMVHDAAEDGLHSAIQIKKDLLKQLHEEEKKMKTLAHNIDRKVHKEPWKAIGGAAAISLAVGFILGRR